MMFRSFIVFLGYLVQLAELQAEGPDRRVALVIGNARYEAEVGALRNSVNDAKAVARALKSLSFTVHETHNVSRDKLIVAVAGFRESLKQADVALFYYAGHGLSIGGSNYLIPIKSGYQPSSPDAATNKLLAETRLFNVDQVVAEMSAAGSSCNLVILDACRNTPVALDPSTRTLGDQGLVEMNPPAGSLIAFATDAGHTAQDGEGANGLYTGELIRYLTSPGLSVEQVFKRTREAVMQASEGTQIPAEYSRLVGDDVFLAGREVEPEVPRASPVPIPEWKEIDRLARLSDADRFLAAIELTTAAHGPNVRAAEALEILLDEAKQLLEEAEAAEEQANTALKLCDATITVAPTCLPKNVPNTNPLLAKAHNRRGDALILLNRTVEAIEAYDHSINLNPTDAYPFYNRGMAHQKTGNIELALKDLTKACDPSFRQPKARSLALAAISECDPLKSTIPAPVE
jgi:tetratricopeptide (TPR) repeat protein